MLLKTQKIRQFLLSLIVIFVLQNCQLSNRLELKMGQVWYDQFGFEYKFENSKVFMKSIFYDYWDEIGSYNLKDYTFFKKCDTDNKLEVKCIEEIPEKSLLAFEYSLSCNYVVPFREDGKHYISTSIDNFLDEEEKLISLKIIAKTVLGQKTIYEINENNKISFHQDRAISFDTIFQIDKSFYSKINTLIGTLPFEKKNNYLCNFPDAGFVEFDITTNKNSIKIPVRGCMPQGLGNLFSSIRNLCHDSIVL